MNKIQGSDTDNSERKILKWWSECIGGHSHDQKNNLQYNVEKPEILINEMSTGQTE